MHKTAWSKQEVDRLRELSLQGLSVMQIARLLGRTYHSTKGQRRQLALVEDASGRRPWTRRDDDLVRRHHAGGIVYAVTALALNRTRRQIVHRAQILGLGPKRPRVPLPTRELIYDSAESLWTQGIKPTRAIIGKQLGVDSNRIANGFKQWRLTCGRTEMEYRRGPAGAFNLERFKASLADAIQTAPQTGFDPCNDGRWPTLEEQIGRYLGKIQNQTVRDTLTLATLLHRGQNVQSEYGRISSFCGVVTRHLHAHALFQDLCRVDPKQLVHEVLQGKTSQRLTEHARAAFLQLWSAFADRQYRYLDQLPSDEADRLRPYCLPRLADAVRYGPRGHCKMLQQKQRDRVKANVELVHGSFHRIRFAAGVRTHILRRMAEAERQAIAAVTADNLPLPYRYQYEETLLDIDGRTYRQRVTMELWDFRAIFSTAIENGYVTTRDRMCDYELGNPPFDKPWFASRHVGTTLLNGKPGVLPWFFEFIDRNIIKHLVPGSPVCEPIRAFNEEWGYPPNRGWAPRSHALHWPPAMRMEIGFLRARGYRFINVPGFYLVCLCANLAIRLATVSGARLGEIQQVAASRDCIVELTNVGPKDAIRWLLMLVPKGRTEREEYGIDEGAFNAIHDLVEQLRQIYGQNKLPIVAAATPKLGPDPYIFQFQQKVCKQEALVQMMRILLHAVVVDPETGKVVDFASHALRHAFATELRSHNVDLDVIRILLHQRHAPTTAYYAQPTRKMVRNAAEVLFVERIDLKAAALRSPPAVQQMLADAEGKIGALTEVFGGTCTVANMCPAKFVCLGCSGNAPDPAKRDQVLAKREWTKTQLAWAQNEGLRAEERQLEAVLQDCDLLLQEMDLIEAYRADGRQGVSISGKLNPQEVVKSVQWLSRLAMGKPRGATP
jgi:hypothetical protein